MTEPPSESLALDDTGLVERALGGDTGSFTALFDRHIAAVYWQAYQVVREHAEAEDVAQDTFVTAWRRLSEINLVGGSVLPWLLVTAKFTALNASRKRGRLRAVPLEHEPVATGRPVAEEVAAESVAAAIAEAVGRLSAIDQQLFAACIAGEQTYDQAAQELGITHAAVRNRVSRLRRRLRGDLRQVRDQESERND